MPPIPMKLFNANPDLAAILPYVLEGTCICKFVFIKALSLGWANDALND